MLGTISEGSVHDTEADIAGDRKALETFFKSLQGDQWRRNGNWMSDKPLSEWMGVEVEHERVVSISLKNNSLRGEIPPEIRGLTRLKSLMLSENFICGVIPAELGQCCSLERVMLDDNELVGEIPGELGSLTRLTHLYAGENKLEGEVPEELGCCEALRNLSLWGNQLRSEFPSESFSELENLCFLDLHNNHFQPECIAAIEEKVTGTLLAHNIILSGQAR